MSHAIQEIVLEGGPRHGKNIKVQPDKNLVDVNIMRSPTSNRLGQYGRALYEVSADRTRAFWLTNVWS